jgi:hypothetical protein
MLILPRPLPSARSQRDASHNPTVRVEDDRGTREDDCPPEERSERRAWLRGGWTGQASAATTSAAWPERGAGA